MPTETFQVEESEAGRRLDQVLAAHLPHLSRSRLQSLVKDGHVTLAGQPVKAGRKVRAGESYTLIEPAPQPVETVPEDITLDVLYEDSDLIVINKPPGMVVHPGAGNERGTLVNALLYHCKDLSGIGGEERPGIVHRLDKETSGCLVAAKNDVTHRNLAEQFAARATLKIYLAVTRGGFAEETGAIHLPIVRHPVDRKKMSIAREGEGRTAWTDYRVLADYGPKGPALVECTLHTGRTHQIRVHLAALGHPLWGDAVYGGNVAKKAERQLLHAWQLGFVHPRGAEFVKFRATPPGDILERFGNLEIS